MTKNAAAVSLGRKGGRANTKAQQLARLRNIARGGRPKLYRIVNRNMLERNVDGVWLALEPPYDLAAQAFLRRNVKS